MEPGERECVNLERSGREVIPFSSPKGGLFAWEKDERYNNRAGGAYELLRETRSTGDMQCGNSGWT